VDSATSKPIINREFDEALPFTSRVAKVGIGSRGQRKFGLINTDGSFVLPCEYDIINSFSQGLAFVGKGEIHEKFNNLIDGKGGIVNEFGSFIFPLTDGIKDGMPFSEGYTWIQKDFKWALIDAQGHRVSGFEYGNVEQFKEGLAAVRKEMKYGFINNKGEVIVSFDYDMVGSFSEQLAPVKKSGKWAYINTDGTYKTGFDYDGASDFSDGLAAVKKGSKWGYINAKGSIVIGFKYDFAGDFKGGLANVSNGKYGFIDRSGVVRIPLKYDDIQLSKSNSEFIVGVGKSEGWAFDGLYGLIDRNGREILPVKFSSIIPVYGNLYAAYSSDVKFSVDNSSYKAEKLYFIESSSKRKYLSKSDAGNGDQSNNTGIIRCPENFKRVTNAQFKGTARKYQAKDGHYYYEVTLWANIPSSMAKYYKGLKFSAKRSGQNCSFCGDISYIKSTKSVTQKVTYIGCIEDDSFYLEGLYTCSDGGFTGLDARLYFRDLQIIK